MYQTGGAVSASSTMILTPQVRILGDVAVVTYIRVVQSASGYLCFLFCSSAACINAMHHRSSVNTTKAAETRVWNRVESGGWVCVHFHRS